MSLTSYRTAPPRARYIQMFNDCPERTSQSEQVKVNAIAVSGARFEDLAATYSPTPYDAVPSALRVFTAEFGMGSGVSPSL